MIRSLAILCAIPLAAFSAPPAARLDLLRFNNGDQLHGTFAGVREGSAVLWQREDLTETAEFNSNQLRQIVLRGASPTKPLASTSHIGLVNGDCIPGRVTGIDAKAITLESPVIGTTRVLRKYVVSLAPNPLGGGVRYFGPFAADDWKMIHPSFPDGLPTPPADGEKKSEDVEDIDQPGRWAFSGAAWYWQNKYPGTALVRESDMPERAILSFDLAWKNQLSLMIGFHADFKKLPVKKVDPEEGGPQINPQVRRFIPGDTSALPILFGNSSVIQIHSNYLMLTRTRVGKDGKPSSERTQVNHEGLKLGDKSHCKVEIRSNRATGEAVLFIDGEFIAQWDGYSDDFAKDFKDYSGTTGFGFLSQGTDASIRISDVMVSAWNGMPDSARSMRSEDKDVILLTNGTDRFAGHVTGMDKDGRVLFESGLGKFALPVEDIAEIRFAGKEQELKTEDSADPWTIRLGPVGALTGRPGAGDARSIGIESPLLGPLKVSMESALLIDLNSSKLRIVDWETDF